MGEEGECLEGAGSSKISKISKVLKISKISLRIVFSLFLIIKIGFASSSEPIQLSTFPKYSRLSIRVDETVPVEWESSNQGFVLTLKGPSSVDLGAPTESMQRERWKARLESIADVRLGKLKVQDVPQGIQISGKWKFPTGKDALAHPVMQSFDFRQKDEPLLIVDFWVKPGPTLAEETAALQHQKILAKARRFQEAQRKRAERKIARVQQEEGESKALHRFCEEPLSESDDLFPKFIALHDRIDFSRWIPSTADKDYVYSRPGLEKLDFYSDTHAQSRSQARLAERKENENVRFAVQLYSQGDFALAIRALDFFDKEFPHSNYRIEMKFLRANALLKLGMTPQGEELLGRLMKDAHDSPLALRAALFLARSSMEKNLPLPAMEKFLWLIRYHSDSDLNWIFHLGVAECLFALKETDRAAKEYQWLVENAPDPLAKADAAIKVGDLYLGHFQYEQASGAYSQAERYFPSVVTKIPNFYLNWGESFYQLGRYDRSQDIFKRFLERYAASPMGWRATFRLGEIAARTSKRGMSSEEARAWFYDTVNHYPFTPGATLSRLRLLPCGDHGGFDLESQERFYQEVEANFVSDVAKQREVFTQNLDDLITLARIRTLMTMSSPNRVIDQTMQKYRTAQSPLLKNILARTAYDYFKKTIIGLLNEGKSFEALSFYTVKSPLLPPMPAVNPHDVHAGSAANMRSGEFDDYLLRLSRAASDYGLGNFAQELSARYSGSGQLDRNIASTAEVKSELDLDDRLRISERSFTQAKALWASVQNVPAPESYDSIRKLLGNVLDESPFSSQKEIILGLIDQREKNPKAALVHATRAQLLGNHLGITFWLSELERETGNLNASFNLLKEVEQDLSKNHIPSAPLLNQTTLAFSNDGLGLPRIPDLKGILLRQAEILERQGNWKEAASTYLRMLNQGWGGNQIAYQYARSLLQGGDVMQNEKARDVLEKIVNNQFQSKNDEEFWKKVAFETLANMPRRGENE